MSVITSPCMTQVYFRDFPGTEISSFNFQFFPQSVRTLLALQNISNILDSFTRCYWVQFQHQKMPFKQALLYLTAQKHVHVQGKTFPAAVEQFWPDTHSDAANDLIQIETEFKSKSLSMKFIILSTYPQLLLSLSISNTNALQYTRSYVSW